MAFGKLESLNCETYKIPKLCILRIRYNVLFSVQDKIIDRLIDSVILTELFNRNYRVK